LTQVTLQLKLWFAHGVIRGMKYLHSRHPPVIHGDLKIQNVLVGDGLVVKVNCELLSSDEGYVLNRR